TSLRRLRYSERNRLRRIVNSHADMLVPGSNELRLAQARNSVSCTRSSARSTLPQSEIAKARRLGTARNMASLTDGFGGILTIPCFPTRYSAPRTVGFPGIPGPFRPRADGSARDAGQACPH